MKYEYLQKEAFELSKLIDAEKLTMKERYALQRILADYNEVYQVGVDNMQFVERNHPIYVKEAEENEKLKAINKKQKQQIIGLKERLKNARNENKELTTKLKQILYK